MTRDLLAAVESAPADRRIDTLGDVIADLQHRFPKHRDETAAWADSYFRVLGKLPPTELRQAYLAVVDRWEKSYPPKPIAFARAAPQSEPNGKPGIDKTRISSYLRVKRRLVDDARERYEIAGRDAATQAAFAHVVERLARAGAQQQIPPDHIEITPELGAEITERAESLRRAAELFDGRTQRAAEPWRPDPAREAAREISLTRAAAEYHEAHGERLTPRETDAVYGPQPDAGEDCPI